MPGENPAIPVAVNRPAATPGTEPRGQGPTHDPSERDSLTPGANRVYQTPPIDIHEGPEGLILEADLPGVNESGVNVQLEDNVLSLYARVESAAPVEGRLIHEEYLVSDFYRSFILSDEVERSQITAELRNGVLRLTLPRAERSRTRRIEVKP